MASESADFLRRPVKNKGIVIKFKKNGQKSALPGSVLGPESADFLRRPDKKQRNRS